MITISKEDYLKAIAEAEAEGQTVIPATLAHWLSVTRPAVTFALKRLKKDGLVSIKKEGHISLTSQGREIAERTMVRHHLIEQMFGMAWYEIHDEAERLEHAVSPAFEKKLVERLGHKDTCPHGNGLALRSPAERRKRGMRLLSEAEAGSKCVVASVYERDRKLLEFFEKEGLRPGVHLAVEARNYDGTVSLSVDKRQIRLGTSSRVGEILRESLTIGGWVSMWRPLEIFLYDWWPIRSEAQLSDRLAAMPVRIRYLNVKSPDAWKGDWPVVVPVGEHSKTERPEDAT
jgi:DtxR family transcriptional regulator, Mn-dependent transcriptional regulator